MNLIFTIIQAVLLGFALLLWYSAVTIAFGSVGGFFKEIIRLLKENASHKTDKVG